MNQIINELLTDIEFSMQIPYNIIIKKMVQSNTSKSFKAKEDNMKGYIIKVTYLTGPHEGKSYFLQKGGFVTSDPDNQWSHNCYKTENICKSVCRQLGCNNKIDHMVEEKTREFQIQHGRDVSDSMIYELEYYEPYFVKNVYNSDVY